MSRRRYAADDKWNADNLAESKRGQRMRDAFEMQDRNRLYDEYDYQRSFGKTHEQACAAVGMKTAAIERMVHRSRERGERIPRYRVGKEKL